MSPEVTLAITQAMGEIGLFKLTADPHCLDRANDAANKIRHLYKGDEEKNHLFDALFHGDLPIGADEAKQSTETFKVHIRLYVPLF